MKNKLQSAYKPTPEPFRDSVRSSVHEATAQTIPQKRRLSGAWRVVIAAVILIALIPCAIFGASKLYELIAKPVDNYGLELNIERETAADYPTYVKMHVEIPEGFAPNDPNNPNNMKFYSLSADEPYTDGFSLRPMRFESGIAESEFIGYVGSYEELTVCGHAAYRVTVEKNGEPLPWERLYVYYEDVNVTLLIYCKDVTEEQIESFVSGINIYANDRAGLLNDVTKTFSERNINLLKVNTMTSRHGIATITLGFEVHSIGELEEICTRMQNIRGVQAVKRTNG